MISYVALCYLLEGVEDNWRGYDQQLVGRYQSHSHLCSRGVLTVMLYLDDGDAHFGGETSHRARKLRTFLETGMMEGSWPGR